MASTSDIVLTTTGTTVPPSFPATAYEAIHAHVCAALQSTPSYKHYLSAWSALAWRYGEALHEAAAFQTHFQQHGESPPAPERFPQERMLFDFFGAAVSSLETLYFAIHAMASKSHPADFPMSTVEELRAVTPTNVIARLKKAYPGDPLIAALEALKSDPRYVDLHNMRNVLTHRGAPGRQFSVGIGTGVPDPPALWDLTAQPLTESTLTLAATDLTSLLSGVMPAVETFALGI